MSTELIGNYTGVKARTVGLYVNGSVLEWSPLRQEPEAPLNIATSRNCLLATPRSSRSRGSAFHPRRDLPRTLMSACRAMSGEPGDAKARDCERVGMPVVALSDRKYRILPTRLFTAEIIFGNSANVFKLKIEIVP